MKIKVEITVQREDGKNLSKETVAEWLGMEIEGIGCFTVEADDGATAEYAIKSITEIS